MTHNTVLLLTDIINCMSLVCSSVVKVMDLYFSYCYCYCKAFVIIIVLVINCSQKLQEF